MTPREGITCRWCGYPIDLEEEYLCVTCREWCASVGNSEAAIGYAAREDEKARADRRKKWEAER